MEKDNELKDTLKQIVEENICKKCGTIENVNFEGMCKECYEETLGVHKEITNKIKSDFLIITQVILIVISIVVCIIDIIFESYILLGTTIISTIIICIILKIFKTIIDILQSIHEKLKRI